MNYKNLLLVACFACTIIALGQEEKYPSFLEGDPSWGSEIIPFPVDWAPGMTLTGYEELLFSPNWSDPESPDFWSLVMGWRITSDHKLGVQEIEDNLRYYFSGLMKPNHWATEFPDPVVALKDGDQETFIGTMDIFDGFHTGKRITLNIRAAQAYDSTSKRYVIVIRISPKPFDHEIWKRLDKIKVAPKMLLPVSKG